MKSDHSSCQCTHCKEIVCQQKRMEHWQLTRKKFNSFVEEKALSVRPDIIAQLSS